MHNKTIAQLSVGLAAGDFSSIELVQHFLKRVKDNHDLNTFVTVTEQQALVAAQAADACRRAGNMNVSKSLLLGIPFAHKDIFCTNGIRTTCGSKMLDNFIAPYDAAVVENMAADGIVSLGKLNMDEFAMGSSNETSFYGGVKNPWDKQRVPGGSSGGSAAAVAARLVPGATGTDTGGSIRQPAAFCGVSGLKPTYGSVSRYGMIAFASSLDQAGPFARTAEDCGLLLQSMAGFDERDSTSSEREIPDYNGELNNSLEGLKIGLPKEFFADGLSVDIAKVIEEAIEEYKKLGAKIVEISLPNSHLSVPVYYVVAPAECSSNLSRMDGVRFGYRCENPKDLEDLYRRSRSEGFGDEVKCRIIIGAYVLSSGYYDAYYIKAQQVRHLISDDFKKAFEKVDVIMGPTVPEVAFPTGEKIDDPVSMYVSDIYTIAVNLAGLPGMSIPIGFVNNKMPVGLQLIGNYFAEPKLLNVAHQFQQATDWHDKVPEGFK